MAVVVNPKRLITVTTLKRLVSVVALVLFIVSNYSEIVKPPLKRIFIIT